MAVLGWLLVQRPQFREDPQDVSPLLRVSVGCLQFQGLHEVLKNDHLLGEVRLVQKLPHVSPRFDELPGLIADRVMGCLDGVKLLELPLKLLPLTLQPDQPLLHETGCLGPHLGEDSEQVVDLGLYSGESLPNEDRFFVHSLRILTQGSQCVVDDLFPKLAASGDSAKQANDGSLQSFCRDSRAGTFHLSGLVILAGAVVVMARRRATGRSLRRHA